MLGVTFGSKHSYNDWGIWLEDTHINPPLPKRYIVDVPARNGLLDLTPELTPTIRFENRTLTFNFRVKAGDWSTLVSQIYGDIHGRTLNVVSDLDSNWHWHGCVTVDDFSSDERTGKLVITVDADPFKLSNTENSYTVNGNGTITCEVDRMEISPAFEIEAPTTVIYGDSSYVIESTAITEKTLSGDIVSFADGTANPAVALNVDIEAVQSGSGDPSPDNIRPISGWDEVNVNVRGVNQWDEEWEVGNINNSGVPTTGVLNSIRSKNFNKILPNTTYYATCGKTDGGSQNVYYLAVFLYDADKNFIVRSYINNTTFTTPENARYFKLATNTSTVVYGNTYNNDISINYPSTDHDYHAYNGQTYTIDLDGTRYGGTLDVTTGVLTVTHKLVDLGAFSWTANWSGTPTGVFYTNVIDYINFSGDAKCSAYMFSKGDNPNYMPNGAFTLFSTNSRIYVKNTAYDNGTAMKNSLSGTMMLYELATPQTVQLTAEQVMILKNQNNIWADSGEVEVTYLAQDFAGKTFYIPDLELTEGSHELTIQGTGTTKVTYTNGRL